MLSRSIRWSALLTLLFVGTAIQPSSLLGQTAVSADSSSIRPVAEARAVPFVSADATSLLTPASITAPWQDSPLNIGLSQPVAVRASDRANVALMGTGAAAVVIGLLVGGDGGTIIALTGGVLGLVGMYRYLR